MKKLLLIIALLLGSICVFAQTTATNNDPKEIELFRGDTVTYEVSGGYGVKWSSSNDYIATVKNGMIVGVHIGTAIITMTSVGAPTSYFIVKVKPKYSLYDDPILDYGISRQELIRKETHRLLSVISDTLDLAYDYSHEDYKTLMLYHFENDSLQTVHSFITDDKKFFEGDFSKIIGFFEERYNFLVSKDKKPIKDAFGFTLFAGKSILSAKTYVHFLPSPKKWIWVWYEPLSSRQTQRLKIKLLDEEQPQWQTSFQKIVDLMLGQL